MTEVEDLLVKHGADCAAVDIRGRIPLHYAFVKMERWSTLFDTSKIRAIYTLIVRFNENLKIFAHISNKFFAFILKFKKLQLSVVLYGFNKHKMMNFVSFSDIN